MNSEGSCDTKDWSNDAENSASHHTNTLHFKYIQIENIYCNDISQYYCFHCIFDQINPALKTYFQKHLKNHN